MRQALAVTRRHDDGSVTQVCWYLPDDWEIPEEWGEPHASVFFPNPPPQGETIQWIESKGGMYEDHKK